MQNNHLAKSNRAHDNSDLAISMRIVTKISTLELQFLFSLLTILESTLRQNLLQISILKISNKS